MRQFLIPVCTEPQVVSCDRKYGSRSNFRGFQGTPGKRYHGQPEEASLNLKSVRIDDLCLVYDVMVGLVP
jgi:hypothetical protein